MPPFIHTIGLPFIALHSIDSTNNYAMRLVNEGMAQHGLTVFTYHQTQGKGQRGKQWLSAPNQNIALSIIIEPEPLLLAHLFGFNMAIALAVRHFFEDYTKDKTKVKWPNDIYWCDRKAGGILIENIIKGQEWKYAIVGIGLNINQTSFDISGNKAVSLKQITGETYDILLLAKELCRQVNHYYHILINNKHEIIARYNQHLYKSGETVTLQKGFEVFKATIKGVNEKGQLLTNGVTAQAFNWGEVIWVL